MLFIFAERISRRNARLCFFWQNDYFPPDWLSLLGVLVNRIGEGDENESSLLFHLLGAIVKSGEEKVAAHIPDIISSIAGAISKQLPPIPEPWPQVIPTEFCSTLLVFHVSFSSFL